MTIRRRLYLTLEPTEKGGTLERIFEILLIIIIILNILAIILDSVSSYQEENREIFENFEIFSVAFFTIEYLARLYSIVESPRFRHRIKGRIKFALTPLALIDLLSFAPFYLSFLFTFLPFDLRLLRIFRLMSLFRMFKVTRYLHALAIFKRVVYDRREQLVLSIILIMFMLVIISTIMFYVEHDAQPTVFSSIPATMWWGVATLTTVGYGDMVPLTPLGKVLGGIFAVIGFGLLALPAGILSSGFFEFMHNAKKTIKCPHCGQDITE
jgi:voltage-gated potassium channel